MSNVKFVLNLPGLNELMKSGEMQGILNSAAAQIAGAAGDGFEAEAAHPISFVAIASVKAKTRKAYHEAMEHKTLEKAAWGAKI